MLSRVSKTVILVLLILVLGSIFYTSYYIKSKESNFIRLFPKINLINPEKEIYSPNEFIIVQTALTTAFQTKITDPPILEVRFKNTNFIVTTELKDPIAYAIGINDKNEDKVDKLYLQGEKKVVNVNGKSLADTYSLEENTFYPHHQILGTPTLYNFTINGKFKVIYFIVKGYVPEDVSGKINAIFVEEYGYIVDNEVTYLPYFEKDIQVE